MTTPILRLLPDTVADGPTQMATDEALLHSAAGGVASFRLYGWSEPTASLGYFQPQADRERALAALPWVRRATGGATLVHDRELTYALALPPGAPWQARGQSWTCEMHYTIAEALATFGVHATLCGCGQEAKLGDVLCFLHQTPGDLLIDGHKVVGSAQRRLRSATLQHGGILLARSPHAPELPGIAELAGQPLDEDAFRTRLLAAFEARTGWRLVPGELTDEEREHIARVRVERYTHPDWNEKR